MDTYQCQSVSPSLSHESLGFCPLFGGRFNPLLPDAAELSSIVYGVNILKCIIVVVTK
jgi:hypothetical protein